MDGRIPPAHVRRDATTLLLNNDNLVLIAAICLHSDVADCVADGPIFHALNLLITALTKRTRNESNF